MAIDPANLKFYRCSVWAEGNSHGGDISVTEITSGADQNIFDDISDAERVAGVAATDPTAYRKVYIKNLNADTWNAVKAWISQFTPASNTEVAVALGSNSDVVSEVKSGGTAPLTFVSPDSKVHADVLNVGNLAQNAYKAVWIRRTVSAGGSGATGDNFKIAFESS